MSTRKFFGHFFGEENVLWAAGEGREPADHELRRRLDAVNRERQAEDALRLAEKWARHLLAINAVKQVMAAAERGEETGLTPEQMALLPELLRRLGGEETPDPFAAPYVCEHCGREFTGKVFEQQDTGAAICPECWRGGKR